MESVKEGKIKKFLSVGDGSSYGDGSSSGDGDGFGYGFGDGSSSGDGDGFGDGYGYGFGYGSGSGAGFGDGFGSGDGFGDGYGFGDGISCFNGKKVYWIDYTQTIINAVFGNYAKGYILNADLTLTPCYIAKTEKGNFAHGETLAEAIEAARKKDLDDMSDEERIDAFIDHFADIGKKHPAKDFFDWHHILTGSCEMGRKQFASDRGIDIDTAEYTVEEFIKMTENAYGREIIRQLKEKLGL